MLSGRFKIQIPQCIVRTWTGLRMNTLLDGDIASGIRSIHPIIFSHGLTASGYQYSGIARELAAHGYMVIMPQHQDGTCTFTISEDGEKMFTKFPGSQEAFYDKELREK